MKYSIILKSESGSKILKKILDFVEKNNHDENLDFLRLRRVCKMFKRSIDSNVSFEWYGIFNSAFRSDDGIVSYIQQLFTNQLTQRRFSPYCLKLFNFNNIAFCYEPFELEYFLGAKKFRFLKVLVFRFPATTCTKKFGEYKKSLIKFSHISDAQLPSLEKIDFKFVSTWWKGPAMGFLDSFKKLSFRTLSIVGLKHRPISKYFTNSPCTEEPLKLFQFLKCKPEITRLEFDNSQLIGPAWESFFRILTIPKHIKTLYAGFKNCLDLREYGGMRIKKPRGNYNTIHEHPMYPTWETLKNISQSFGKIGKLIIDGNVFRTPAELGACGKIPFVVNTYAFARKALSTSLTLKEYEQISILEMYHPVLKDFLRVLENVKIVKIDQLTFENDKMLEQFLTFFERTYWTFKLFRVRRLEVGIYDFNPENPRSMRRMRCLLSHRKRMIRFFRKIGFNEEETIEHVLSVKYPKDGENEDQEGHDILFQRRCRRCRKKNVKNVLLKICSGCKKRFYCSIGCQRNDWKSHRTFCRKNRK